MTTITCRSPQEIADDELLSALDMCEDALRAFIPGMGYMHRGPRRARIAAMRDRLNVLIEQGQSWQGLAPVGLAAYAAIYL